MIFEKRFGRGLSYTIVIPDEVIEKTGMTPEEVGYLVGSYVMNGFAHVAMLEKAKDKEFAQQLVNAGLTYMLKSQTVTEEFMKDEAGFIQKATEICLEYKARKSAEAKTPQYFIKYPEDMLRGNKPDSE
ncbi:MAG: hypothetical protein V1870_05830 [Candidatus Aenigmatarchaeota archaeon]